MSKLRIAIRLGFVAALLAVAGQAQTAPAQKGTTIEAHAHEYAPLREATLEIKDFSFKTLDDKLLNLREAVQGKQLVLVHYFAAWCHNSNYDVETINELYRKYKDYSFQVIGVCEYSKPEELRDFIKRHNPAYPICLESEKTKDRLKTTHYAYRTAAQDPRLWGTPFNMMLQPSDFNASGEVVVKRAQVAFGELMKTDVEAFIKQQLKVQ
jgi:peroxiredoxin